MSDQPISLRIRPTFWEHVQACSYVFLRRYWIAVAAATAVVFLETAGTVLLIAQGKLPIVNPYFSFWLMELGYLVLLTSPLRCALRAHRASLKQSSSVYVFDEEGMSAPAKDGYRRTPWSSVRFVQETGRHLLVHTTPTRFEVLPKRLFTSQDLSRFREIASGMRSWRSKGLLAGWF